MSPHTKGGACLWCDNDEAHCEVCGEHIRHSTADIEFYLEEAGEFVRDDEHIIAHAQCGIDAGLELA